MRIRSGTMSFTDVLAAGLLLSDVQPVLRQGQGCLNDSFAWIHGDYSNDIGQTWLGMVGPGVKNGGIDASTWTDHADIVRRSSRSSASKTTTPTTVTCLAAGRWSTTAVPAGLSAQKVGELEQADEQLNAPFGEYSRRHAEGVDVRARRLGRPTTATSRMRSSRSTAQRDALVGQIRDVLD